MNPGRAIGRRFGAAADRYETNAPLQRLVAHQLAAQIVASFRSQPPRRILEIGCGTGLLTRALRKAFPDALIVASDLSPRMIERCLESMPGDPLLLGVAMDGTLPAVRDGYDLVCSSLALQWFADRRDAFATQIRLLSPSGRLQVATLADGTLAEWCAAHAGEGASAAGLTYPSLARLGLEAPGRWTASPIAVPYPDGISFVRGLRAIGAHHPAAGHRPLDPGRMRRVLRRFEREHGATAHYVVAFGEIVRPARRGAFVTGTDTGIGKTLVSACLVRAWRAEYWKPLQTGLDDDPGDSETVQRLSGCDAARIHPPAIALRAPLSPEDAASLEGIVFDPAALMLPGAMTTGDPPLVVEGAGGVLVPLDGQTLMVELIQRLGLPVVLVARSTLGTINHTLLSLEALRARGVVVAGVVLNGPPNPGNRLAIERHGKVKVLAELPTAATLDDATLQRFADRFGALPAV